MDISGQIRLFSAINTNADSMSFKLQCKADATFSVKAALNTITSNVEIKMKKIVKVILVGTTLLLG